MLFVAVVGVAAVAAWGPVGLAVAAGVWLFLRHRRRAALQEQAAALHAAFERARKRHD